MSSHSGAARMIRMGLSPRAKGLSRVEVQRRWGGRHAELFSRVANLVSYVQNHAVLDESDQPLLGDPGFDIFSEVEFASRGTMTEATSSNYYQQTIIADERDLLDTSRRAFVTVERKAHASSNSPDGTVKLIHFLPEKNGAPYVDIAPGCHGAMATWEDRILDIAGWRGDPPATVRQIQYPTPEQAVLAHREFERMGGKALQSVIVRNKLIPVRAAASNIFKF